MRCNGLCIRGKDQRCLCECAEPCVAVSDFAVLQQRKCNAEVMHLQPRSYEGILSALLSSLGTMQTMAVQETSIVALHASDRLLSPASTRQNVDWRKGHSSEGL